jgi:2-oxoglutarate dehydrogenase E1 component
VDLDTLADVNQRALQVPPGFALHRKLARQLARRGQDFGPEGTVDWAHAELLAFGSILEEGIPIRLTGQDSERGTFSQRHLVLHDEESGEKYTPLGSIGSGRFEVYNSPLTEMAVVGFEYGYSVGAERDFVLWEAQFGDFVNVAQVMVDQFISSGRAKWGQLSRLTMLLPHGYEGQGPEHSSARIERFLQLCAEDNIRVTYPTTPAQYFHLLRRQAHALPERPLIAMTPKSLLRHPRATSTVRELAHGRFRPVIADPRTRERTGEITRLVLCTGKVYYDLAFHDTRSHVPHAAVARVEQLYPFPMAELEALTRAYPNLREVVWTQEEPFNMGALSFVGPRLRAVVPRSVSLRYVARPERASPAEGRAKDHASEQARLVREGLGGSAAGGSRE